MSCSFSLPVSQGVSNPQQRALGVVSFFYLFIINAVACKISLLVHRRPHASLPMISFGLFSFICFASQVTNEVQHYIHHCPTLPLWPCNVILLFLIQYHLAGLTMSSFVYLRFAPQHACGHPMLLHPHTLTPSRPLSLRSTIRLRPIHKL